MIKKLRIKLIIASMASLLVVLFVIMTAVSILNYQKLVGDADSTLAILAANDGFFPKTDRDGPKMEPPMLNHPPMSPEMPYETRYFFVMLDGTGEVESVNTGKIAAVDTSTAIAYAQRVWQGGDSQGFLADYRYLVHPSGESSMVLFLDCSRSLDSFRSLLLSCACVSVTGALLVLLLLLVVSGRMVRPFLENYEKQKRFITDAGHELKTPLTIIQADTEILELDLGENEWLHDIQTQTRRLSDLTHDLILLARMEEQQTPQQQMEFPLSDVVEETTAPFQAVAQTKEKTLELHIQPMLSMMGDENALRKLVSILLDNGVKYAPTGSTISCTLEKRRNMLCLSVCNPVAEGADLQTGRLFDRFYRGDPSRSTQTGGYGLGLSIAAAIVSAHRGKLTADGGDGTTLQITASFPT